MELPETDSPLELSAGSQTAGWVTVEGFGLYHISTLKLTAEDQKNLNQRIADYKSYKTFGRKSELPLRQILWTMQRKVDRQRVEAYSVGVPPAGNPVVLTRKEVTVIDHRGHYILLDGNHRISSMRFTKASETTILPVIII